jgi:ZIP family zinc transporter
MGPAFNRSGPCPSLAAAAGRCHSHAVETATSANFLFAFALTALAGLSTGIGSAIALFFRRTNVRFLSLSLGLSAGVMIYVSFVEILAEAQKSLSDNLGERAGSWAAAGAFFGGVLVIALIDRLVPSVENPHEARRLEALKEAADEEPRRKRMMRMGLMTAVAIAVHNFPEGMAAFASALTNPTIGVPIAVAIAIHNIPEGISVSVPIYQATGSRKKAFWWSFLSGLAEPAGALIGYGLLRALLSEAFVGVLLGAVAGIMVFISLDELFPTAREYGEGHLAIYGLIAGMAIMALSLLLLH